MLCLIGVMGEARRYLDGRGWQRLCGQAAPRRDRAGRQFRRHGFDHYLRLHIRRDGAPLFRLVVKPNDRNGLRTASRLMVDKITTVPKSKIGGQVGRLDDEDIVRLNQAMLVFLGMAVSPRTKGEV